MISAAETLSPDERAAIGTAFARPVGEVYQATERVLVLAYPAGRLHLNEH